VVPNEKKEIFINGPGRKKNPWQLGYLPLEYEGKLLIYTPFFWQATD